MLSRSTPLKSRSTLKRTSSLRRTGPIKSGGARQARSNVRAEPSLPVISNPSRFRLPAPVTGEVNAVPKRVYVRSKPLREAYRLIPCQGCQASDGTVVCAHSNWGVHGKGGRIKADDNRGAALCNTCHMKLDQGSELSETERKAFWWLAHVRSVALMCERRLWPADVPVPNILDCDL